MILIQIAITDTQFIDSKQYHRQIMLKLYEKMAQQCVLLFLHI